jgi:hypothetical protein
VRDNTKEALSQRAAGVSRGSLASDLPEGGRAVLGDLAALTPPLVVCAACTIAIGAFLRHEMSPRRRIGDDALSADIPVNDQIPDAEMSEAATPPDAGTGNDRSG